MSEALYEWMLLRAKEPTTWVGLIGWFVGLLSLTIPNDVVQGLAIVVAFGSSSLLIAVKQTTKKKKKD